MAERIGKRLQNVMDMGSTPVRRSMNYCKRTLNPPQFYVNHIALKHPDVCDWARIELVKVIMNQGWKPICNCGWTSDNIHSKEHALFVFYKNHLQYTEQYAKVCAETDKVLLF